MFPVTVTLHNAAQLQAVLTALNPPSSDTTTQPPASAKPEDATEKKPKSPASTSAKTTEAPAPTPPTARAAGAGASESKGDNSAQEQSGNDEAAWNAREDYKDTPEYQAVASAVVAVAKVKGREAAAALLEKVAGVKSLSESKPSQAAAVIAVFQAEGV